MKKISEKDLGVLGILDAEWRKSDFQNFMGIPGSVGYMHKQCFMIGLEIEETFFVERLLLVKAERDEFMEEMRFKYKEIHIDLILEKKNHDEILYLIDEGYQCHSQSSHSQEVKIRLTKEP